MKFYTNPELSILVYLARIALSDADIFDQVAEEMNLTDKEMQALRDKIENTGVNQEGQIYYDWNM